MHEDFKQRPGSMSWQLVIPKGNGNCSSNVWEKLSIRGETGAEESDDEQFGGKRTISGGKRVCADA